MGDVIVSEGAATSGTEEIIFSSSSTQQTLKADVEGHVKQVTKTRTDPGGTPKAKKTLKTIDSTAELEQEVS